jgi:hypothetical protein
MQYLEAGELEQQAILAITPEALVQSIGLTLLKPRNARVVARFRRRSSGQARTAVAADPVPRET